MMNFTKMISNLNLLYYEYNVNYDAFMPDSSYSPAQRYDELMKLTYELSKNKFEYHVEKDKSVRLVKKTKEKKGFIASNIESLKMKMKINSMNIYTLSDKKIKPAQNIPLYKIYPVVSEIDFSDYDALVFTSQNGVKAVDTFTQDWKKIPSYAIAPQTAKTIKKLGGNLKFVGVSKHGDEFAQELAEVLKGKRVLYLRGKKVVSNLIEKLNNADVVCDDIIVYENRCNSEIKVKELPENSYIIFSSPSTIECFFKKFTWKESYTAISIGNTTAKYFPKEIIPVIADTTSLESCINKAIELELSADKQ
jgi:uroporphyrinogen-III synthase